MDRIRRSIEKQVHALVGFGSGEIDLDRPAGDPGLFGPGSAAWRVHGDFTSMMIGGMSALLLQMLHPLVLGGVWDHSNFRHDMIGRLRRTAQFISGTTYGSTDQALRLIRRVTEIHAHVHGTIPDGTPYSARDPALLTWVHVAEVSSFLRAHIRYRDPRCPRSDRDRYFAEMAGLAYRLGARSVPETCREVEAYFEAIKPRLRADDRTREIARAIMSSHSTDPSALFFHALMSQAAVDLLPDWARRMHGLPIPRPARPLIRGGAQGVGIVMRWALRDGSARRAKQRMATGDHAR